MFNIEKKKKKKWVICEDCLVLIAEVTVQKEVCVVAGSIYMNKEDSMHL